MIDLLFPKECLVCSKTGLWLCKTCQKELYPTLPNCYVCKKLSNGFLTHKECYKDNSLESVVTLWKYNECSRKLIHNFKYKNRFRIADFLFSLFENKLKSIDLKKSLLVPIPSYKRKTLDRGFNPTQIICELIAQKIQVNTNFNLVLKDQSNVSQASLSYQEREKNVEGIFKINEDEINRTSGYNRIIIIDDIMTTGATMKEAGSIVKKYLGENVAIQGISLFQGSFKEKKG